MPVANRARPIAASTLVRALQDHATRLNGDAGVFDRVDVRVLGFDSSSDGLTDRASVDLGVRTPPGCDVDALIEVARAGCADRRA